jgi:hypothetical protein
LRWHFSCPKFQYANLSVSVNPGAFVVYEDVPLLILHIRILTDDAAIASLSSLFAIRSAIANRMGDIARRLGYRAAFLGGTHITAESAAESDHSTLTIPAYLSPRQFRQVIIEQHLPSAVSHLRCMRAALSHVAHAAQRWRMAGVIGSVAGQTRDRDVTLALDAALVVYFALRQESICPS